MGKRKRPAHCGKHSKMAPSMWDRHEDQAFRRGLLHLGPERAALLLHVGPVLFAGVQALLLARQESLAQGAPQGLQAAVEAAAPLELLQGGGGLLADQRGRAAMVLRPQGGGRSSPIAAWVRECRRRGGAGAGGRRTRD